MFACTWVGLVGIGPGLSVRRLSSCPFLGKHFRLLQDRLGRFLFFVRRITVLAQDRLHKDAQFCTDVLAERPVDGDVVADRS